MAFYCPVRGPRRAAPMRLIQLDPGRDPDRAAVRNLQFHPTGRSLAGVVGDPDHFRDLCRYRLDADAPVVVVQPDETEGYVPTETGPDPVASRDLELVAVGVLDYEGLPSVAVIDTWANEQTAFWFDSGAELITFPAFAFSADNGHFYAATSDRFGAFVRGWNLDALFEDDAADAELEAFARPHDLAVDEVPSALCTDPLDKFVAVGTSAGGVWLLDARREEHPRRLATVRGGVRSVQFASGGAVLLVVAAGAVVLIDARSGTKLGQWSGPYPAASLSPDGRRLALVDAAGTLTMSDVATGEVLTRLDAGVGPLSGVAFAPDGLTCAVGAAGGVVIVWDV